MKHMYEITPRGNEYIYGKILLDNFNVCHSCRQFYPIDRCPDAVLADPKLLSKKSVYDFIISDMVYNHHFSVRIAKKSFLEQLGWDDVLKNFSMGNLYYPHEKINCEENYFDTNLLQPGELYDEWVTIRPLNSIQPRGKCIDTTSRYLCSECNRLRYISSSFFYVDGTFDYDTMYEYGGLIVPERIFERIKDMDWKKNNLYKPAKIKIIKKPIDGFPLDLREDCPDKWQNAEEYQKKLKAAARRLKIKNAIKAIFITGKEENK